MKNSKHILKKLDNDGRITIPSEFRKLIGIEKGDMLVFSVNQNDNILNVSIFDNVKEKKNIAQLLFNCLYKVTGIQAVLVNKGRTITGFVSASALKDEILDMLNNKKEYMFDDSCDIIYTDEDKKSSKYNVVQLSDGSTVVFISNISCNAENCIRLVIEILERYSVLR